jgi:PAS domain S-box-containing protein
VSFNESLFVSQPSDLRLKSVTEPLAVSVVVILLIAAGAATFFSFQRLQRNRERVYRTHRVLLAIDAVETTMIDGETGQRGYLITGRQEYLQPYESAMRNIERSFAHLEQLTSYNPDHRATMAKLESLIQERRAQLQTAITVRRELGYEAAAIAVNDDVGKRTMDAIRAQLARIRNVESDLMTAREQAAQQSYRTGLTGTVLSTVMGIGLVGGLVYLVQHNRRRAEKAAKAIHAERERLRVTLASIGDGVISTDELGNVTYLNSVAEGLTGWANEDARGHKLDEVFCIINEDSRQTVENPATRALREGVIVGLANHTLLLSKDGRETPIDDSAAPIRSAREQVIGVVLVFRDVTARRQEDRRVANSAEFTRKILDGLGEMVIVLDGQGRILSLNRIARDTLHISESDDIGHSLYELAGGAFDRPDVRELINEAQSNADQTQDHLDLWIHLPASGDRALELAVSRFDPALELAGSILLVITDRTEQRELEEKNTRLSQHTRWFLEQIQDYAIFTMDADGRATSWNQGVERVLGYSEEEFLGQDVPQLICMPETIAKGTVAAEFKTAAEEGQASDDRWVLRKGHIPIWASGVTTALKNEQGELVGYSKLMRDLTLRKRERDELDAVFAQLRTTEERRRLALDAAELGSWNIDTTTNELVTDRRFREIYGVTDKHLSYEQAFEIVHPEDRQRIRDAVAAATRAENPIPYVVEYRVVHPDGEIRWVIAQGAAHFEGTDKNLHLVSLDGTIADITKRKLADEQLLRMAADLSEADRRKNEFLATLAHELRNPLAPIKNAVQLLGMSKLDDDAEELRQMMARQVEQLVRLIDDLLDVSRISRGKIALQKEFVDLSTIVDAAVEASSAFIAESGQDLVLELPSDPIILHADPTRIAQVITNLLNNAAKYSDAGCRIELAVMAEDGQAVIQVRDDGFGIDAERLEDIFQMFTQVDDSLQRGSAGLGIGLTLVRTLVELHGGEVSAESPGKGLGSVFTVRLPIAVDAPLAKQETPLEMGAATRRFKILVVEDMRSLRVILARLLRKLGHEVETVENGAEALDKLDSFMPEIIFSDISMPGMTGYELARRLRARSDTAGLLLVAMTGYGQAADRDKALEAGFDEHLVKPVDVQQLQRLFQERSQVAQDK